MKEENENSPKYSTEVIDLSQKKFRELQQKADIEKKIMLSKWSELMDVVFIYSKTRKSMIAQAEFLDDASGISGHINLIHEKYPKTIDFTEITGIFSCEEFNI